MNLELTPEDFAECILDTYGDDKKNMDVMGAYPFLKKVEGFDHDFKDWDSPAKEKNRTIKFINYFYSRNETLERKYPEYKQRKAACAIAAGFYISPKDGTFQEHVKEMLEGKNNKVNRMVVSFLRFNFNDKFTTLAHIRETFYNKISSDEEMAVMDLKRLLEVEAMMEGLKIQLLRGDQTPEISAALLQKFEEISLDLKPEDIAGRIRDRKNPVSIEVYK